MTRTEARERLMQLLFQMEARNEYDTKIKTDYVDEHFKTKQDKRYADTVIDAVILHLEEIDSMLNHTADRWHTGRMPKVDLAVCRLALGEILYFDTPDAVIINEAVDIAKKFGTDDSPKFINGILGKIVKEKISNEQ